MQLPWTSCQLKALEAWPAERRRLQAIYAAERRRPPYNHAYSATDIGRNTYSEHCTTPMANSPSTSAQQTVLYVHGEPSAVSVSLHSWAAPIPWTSSHRALQLVGVSRVQYHISTTEVTRNRQVHNPKDAVNRQTALLHHCLTRSCERTSELTLPALNPGMELAGMLNSFTLHPEAQIRAHCTDG
jgi:hypothetical protein